MRARLFTAMLAGLLLTGANLPRTSDGVSFEQVGSYWALMHLNEGCAASMANKGVFDVLLIRRDRNGHRSLVILIKGDWRRSSGEALFITALKTPATNSILFSRRLFFTRGAWTGAGTYFVAEMPPELYRVLGRTFILGYTNGSSINNSFVLRETALALSAFEVCQPMQAQAQ